MYPSLSIIDTAGERSQQLLADGTPQHRVAVEPHRTHPGLRDLPDSQQAPTVIPVGTAGRTVRIGASQSVAAALRAMGAVLRWVADRPCDSRDRLRTKEQDLAILGIRWVSDPDDDAALALEIAVARQQRWALDVLARGAAAAASPDSPPPIARGHRRNSTIGREGDHRMAVQVP
jgi:hypothetical protein